MPRKKQLHCLCHKPEVQGVAMICCDTCEVWYHPRCLKLSKKQFEKAQAATSFVCTPCKESGDNGDIYDIDHIVERRPSTKKRGKFEYLISWKGYSTEDNTWEPEENLLSCWELKTVFDARMDRSKKKKSKPGKSSASSSSSSSSSSPTKKKNKKKRKAPAPEEEEEVGRIQEEEWKSKLARRRKEEEEEKRAQQEEKERRFRAEHGDEAWSEMQLHVDTFINTQRATHKNLTPHQIDVFRETYVKIYTVKLHSPAEEGGEEGPGGQL